MALCDSLYNSVPQPAQSVFHPEQLHHFQADIGEQYPGMCISFDVVDSFLHQADHGFDIHCIDKGCELQVKFLFFIRDSEQVVQAAVNQHPVSEHMETVVQQSFLFFAADGGNVCREIG